MSEGSDGGFFCGVDLFEIFIGVFVEGFDAAFAAEADELTLVEGVDGFAHGAEFVARDGAGGEGIGFGEFGCFGFFFWGFDDLGLRGFRSGGVGGVGERDEAEGEQDAGYRQDYFHRVKMDEHRKKASWRSLVASEYAFAGVGGHFFPPALESDAGRGGGAF